MNTLYSMCITYHYRMTCVARIYNMLLPAAAASVATEILIFNSLNCGFFYLAHRAGQVVRLLHQTQKSKEKTPRVVLLKSLFLPFCLIQEFKFMGQCRSPSVSPSRQVVSSTSPPQEELSLFQQYLQEGNPFEMHIEHKEEETEDVLASNGVSAKERLLQHMLP